MDKLGELRYAPQLLTFLLRISPENSLRQNGARFAPRLGHGQDVARSNLELTFAAVRVAIPQIKGFASRASDLKQKARKGNVEKIDPPGTHRALAMPNKCCRQGGLRHRTDPTP